MPIIGNFPTGGAGSGLTGQKVQVVAKDKIKLGNMVYTVSTEALDLHAIGDLEDAYGEKAFMNTSNGFVFSPDGSFLAIWESSAIHLYAVEGEQISYIKDLEPTQDYKDTCTSTFSPKSVAFSPDSNVLVICDNYAILTYTVDGGNTQCANEYFAANDSSYANAWLSPDGNTLVVCGTDQANNAYFVAAYQVNETEVSEDSTRLYCDGNQTSWGYSTFNDCVFSKDGHMLVISASGHAVAVYKVDGTQAEYVGGIPTDADGTLMIGSDSDNFQFGTKGPDGTDLLFILKSNALYITDVSETGVTPVSVFMSAEDRYYTVKNFGLSPDGSRLAVSALIELGSAQVMDVYKISTDWSFDRIGSVDDINFSTCAFSTDNTLLVGYNDLVAHYFEIGETSVTKLENDCAFSSYRVDKLTFAPGKHLLLMSGLERHTAASGEHYNTFHVCTVALRDGKFQYVQDIYATGPTSQLMDSVMAAVFSPDGSLLVIGGAFPGFAKLYAVHGTTITYLQDIQDVSGSVSYAAFSPDGSKLLLYCGSIYVFSVQGQTVTYTDKIDVDASGFCFSADGRMIAWNYSEIYVYAVDGDTFSLVHSSSDDSYMPQSATLFPGVNSMAYVTDNSNALDITIESWGDDGNTVDTGTISTGLSSILVSVSLSPDGALLAVLACQGTEYCKIYKVTYSDGGAPSLDELCSLHGSDDAPMVAEYAYKTGFSSDGKTFVIYGYFVDEATEAEVMMQFYHVEGTTFTYLGSLDGDEIENNYVWAIDFSSSAPVWVMCGDSGLAKIFGMQQAAYLATTTPWTQSEYLVGVALENIDAGDKGDVTVVADRDERHTHQKTDITDFAHTHDVADISGAAASGHTHDDRYYTESEVDAYLADKAPLTYSVPTKTVTVAASELVSYINNLPRLVTNNLFIDVSGGTISETLNLNGFYGPGSITLGKTGSTDVVCTKGITVTFTSVQIVINYFTISGVARDKTAGYVYCSTFVDFANCVFSGDGSNRAVASAFGSEVFLISCSVDNFSTAVLATAGSIINIVSATASGSATGCQTFWGGIILLVGSTPDLMGGSANSKSGGIIVNSSGTLI